jgi:hypothetical protein
MADGPTDYEKKFQKYKKYKELLQSQDIIKRRKCLTCDEKIHIKRGRCQWCEYALEMARDGTNTFKECRDALEPIKREIELTNEKHIDTALGGMHASLMTRLRQKFKFGLDSYHRPEINLGPLRTYKEISKSDYQKNERSKRKLDIRSSQYCLKDAKSPKKGQRKAPRTISEHMAVAMRDEKLAKKEELRLVQKMYNYAREDRGFATKGDRGFKERQLFYDRRINKPGLIGKENFSK